ncbi:ATPase [Saccharobesus litoralis]|uniref:ATPase n=1 Tax=Saccharobesus litoralis TaxID=2172099 RepID=A0A2S0VX17_9ALTE|nr:permease [Saccharobesus litoralis]AWB68776.1 ATPase [Saccharobesus litoralis]
MMSNCCSSKAKTELEPELKITSVAPNTDSQGTPFTPKRAHKHEHKHAHKEAVATPSCCHAATQTTTCQQPKPSGLEQSDHQAAGCCAPTQRRLDYVLWLSILACLGLYLTALVSSETTHSSWQHAAFGVYELVNTMWWSVLLAILFVGLLSQIPQQFVTAILGQGGTKRGLLRATAAGVLMDLCNHGILMVGMKLYQKGASLGQIMAFLIASPWNSISLTLILIALMGWQWTLAFVLLSALLALSTGWLFDRFEQNGTLPKNPYQHALAADFKFWPAAKASLRATQFNQAWWQNTLQQGVKGSVIVIKWLLIGILMAVAIRTFVSLDNFQDWFGPTLIGLSLTLVAATIIEVCSEGSAPIAGDLMTRAQAPGNSFAFLMAGVATDYTEVMVIKQTLGSWKVALFLPLLTLPQVLVIAYALNVTF